MFDVPVNSEQPVPWVEALDPFDTFDPSISLRAGFAQGKLNSLRTGSGSRNDKHWIPAFAGMTGSLVGEV